MRMNKIKSELARSRTSTYGLLPR